MDLIRRNTDYAVRAMVYLAKTSPKEPVSSTQISRRQDISYELLCKLLQKLQKNRLVKSSMGPKGGFRLARATSKINLLEIIEAIQGPVTLNRCLLPLNDCPLKKDCPVEKELAKLQRNIKRKLKKLTLSGLVRKKRK